MQKHVWIGITVILLGSISCVKLDKLEDNGNSVEIAIPLIDSDLSIVDLLEDVDENTRVLVADDGKVTVFYEGDLLRITAPEVFPPIPILSALPIIDTSAFIVSDFKLDFETRLLNFVDTDVSFQFSSSFQQDIEVTIWFPEIEKDDTMFETTFTIPANHEGIFSSDTYSWDTWSLFGDLNSIEVHYDARLPDGSRVVLDDAGLYINILTFDYAEISLNNELFDLAGEEIEVDVYSGYQSGGLFFDDPRLSIIMDYSFGFPAIARVNKFEIINTEGEKTSLIGTLIEDGFQVNQPSIVGESEVTSLRLTNENSNIDEIFNQQTVAVNYDVDVLSFPGEEMRFGWVTDNSFVDLNVAVELPILLSAENLELSDTLTVDPKDFENLRTAELKIIAENEFPIDIELSVQAIDANGIPLFDVIAQHSLTIPHANLLTDFSTQSQGEIVHFVALDEEQMDLLRADSRLVLRGNLSTKMASETSVWLLEEYELKLRIGAKGGIDDL